MARFGVRLDGMKELEKEFDELMREAPDLADKAVRKGAEVVLEKEREQLAPGSGHPYATGDLAGKLTIRMGKGQARIGAFGRHAAKGCWIEFGHGGPRPAPAHPFMEPAWIGAQDEALEAIADAVKEALGV